MKRTMIVSAIAALILAGGTGAANAFDVEAGPIWDNDDATGKCPQVCQDYGGWNGNWATTVEGVMSVCGCNEEYEGGADDMDAGSAVDAEPPADAGSSVRDNGEYLASIGLFGGSYCPKESLEAAGQLLPIGQNQALFSLFGTTYGGDGQTNFALPDLRGKAPVPGMRYCVPMVGIYPTRD